MGGGTSMDRIDRIIEGNGVMGKEKKQGREQRGHRWTG